MVHFTTSAVLALVLAVLLTDLLPSCSGKKHGKLDGRTRLIDISSGILNPDPKANKPVMAEYMNAMAGLVEGDMRTNKKQGGATVRGAAHSDHNKLWPQGIVPYILDATVTEQSMKDQLQKAIADYNQYTCIKFVPRTDEIDYVKFTAEYPYKGCWADLGRSQGEQLVSLGDGCWDEKGTVIHEMMHALGFEHEHKRTDRDKYVKVDLTVVPDQFHFNFEKIAANEEKDLGFPYDYQSVMHYGAFAFSTKWDERTITAKDKSYLDKIGQRAGFSEQDVKEINTFYKCRNGRSDIGGVNGCMNKNQSYCDSFGKPWDHPDSVHRCADDSLFKYCKRWCTGDCKNYFHGMKPPTCFDRNYDNCQQLLEDGRRSGRDYCSDKYQHHKYCRKTCGRC